MKSKYFYFCLFLIINLFSSCVSKQICIRKSNLCGIIVDENNKPVKNYLVVVSNGVINKKSAYTNSSGIFVIPDMSVGEYVLSGHKLNFGKIEKNNFYFDGNSTMLCCQVSTLEELLNKTDQCILNMDYEQALNFINEITVEKNHCNSGLIFLYKIFLYKKMNDMDAYTDCIKQIKKIENDNFRKFIKKGDVGV